MKYLPIIILLSLLMNACQYSSRVQTVLDKADRQVFTEPDSAATLLDSLDLSSASTAQRARHALLLTKAHTKAHIDFTNDSLIYIASDYYRGRGDSLEVQSLFYHGAVLKNRGDYSEALIMLMEAAERATDTGDYFYYAMACREQAGIYINLYEFEQALNSNRQAIEAFNRCDRPLHAAWARIYQPQSLTMLGRTAEAYDSIRILERDSMILSDDDLRQTFYYIAATVYYKIKAYEKADVIYNAITDEGGILDSKMLSQMAEVKLALGHDEQALEMYDMAIRAAVTHSDTLATLMFLSDYHLKHNEYKEAYWLYRKAQGASIMNENELITHPYTAQVSDYYHTQNTENIEKACSASQRALIYALIMIVALAIVIMLIMSTLMYRSRVRQKQLENDVLISDMRQLKYQLESINDSYRRHGSKKYIFPNSLLNNLLEARYTFMHGDDSYKKFGKRVAECVDALATQEAFVDLELYVNYTNFDLMSRFREQVSSLPDSHYRIAILTFAGFPNSSIAYITKLKDGSLRNIRTKIRSAINNSNADDRETFLSYFPSLR